MFVPSDWRHVPVRYVNVPPDVMGTDLTRWRLKTDEGNHRWIYLAKTKEDQHPQSLAERYFLGLPTVYIGRISALARK